MGAKKKTFFKNDPRSRGMPKHAFLAHFQPVVACFGPPKIQKCVENGLFWDKKMCFSKNDPGALGVPKQVKCAHFEPIVSHFGPSTPKMS